MEFIVQFGSSWTCLVLLGSATLLSSSGNLCLSLDVEDDEEFYAFELLFSIADSEAMTLTDKVLRKKAKKFESQAFQKNQTSFTHLPDLDLILNDVYHVHYPKPVDYINRRDLVRILNTMAKEIYGNSDDSPVVEEYGSFLMDMFSPQSDLDLSVNFGNNGVCAPHEKKIQTLRKFAKKLHSLRSNI
ncbi:uncharacterized protein LOC110816425 [Carica papaya]|uniref:uncharacterized protein LOC110816425 n=1 Tax=Carica papaya TaxID=3649 RepID=UPI000B8CE8D2|nr:uncharacterized protein LOC110816425 [Carica papaya]